jgi:peptidoglycan/LPS O-acetylase OafA/YrhL
MSAPVEIGSSRRNLQLDALRGVAIVMVLVCHTKIFRQPGWENVFIRPGWAGVDLFFVLSGFLISGLLFAEYKRTGRIRFRRFALRRALKIYPAFYSLVFLAVAIRLVHHHNNPGPALDEFLHDVFFIQSYAQGLYPHFWSLAVEEQFYILLPVMLFFLMRRAGPGNADRFGSIPWLFALVAAAALVLRLWTQQSVPAYDPHVHLNPTHLRIDALLFGVVLSYWSNFHAERFWNFARARILVILAAAAALLTPLCLLELENSWMHTWGFATNYLGFGALLIASLCLRVENLPGMVQRAFRVLAYVGTFSYSIYLWHLVWLELISELHVAKIPYVGVTVYFAGSIAIGILTSKLIEMPVLRLRERFFPPPAVQNRGPVLEAVPAGGN